MIALIPLRGGSKSIPMKNIKEMAGKPLCAWVINAARGSGLFKKVIASTDSDKIAEVAEKYDAEILIRPAEYATDTATTESVMLHAAENYDFDVICTIQATSPLITYKDLLKAYDNMLRAGNDSLFTATRTKKFLWSDGLVPLNYNPQSRPMRQEWKGTLVENGAFYFTCRHILLRDKCRLGGNIGVYEIPYSVDIDEPEDWLQAEKLLLARGDCL
jgi:N-acylneuraminate cytidylyltransferase